MDMLDQIMWVVETVNLMMAMGMMVLMLPLEFAGGCLHALTPE